MLRCACCYPYISNPTYDSRCFPEPRTPNTLTICLAGEGSAEYLMFSRRRSPNAAMNAGMSSTATCMLARWRSGPGIPTTMIHGSGAAASIPAPTRANAGPALRRAWMRPAPALRRHGRYSWRRGRGRLPGMARPARLYGEEPADPGPDRGVVSATRHHRNPGAHHSGFEGGPAPAATAASVPSRLRCQPICAEAIDFPPASISASSGLGDCAHANSRQHRLNGFGFRCPFGNRSPRPAQTVSATLCSAARRRSIWGLRPPR